MDKVIFQSAILDCSQEKAFEMFSGSENLQKWLTVKAEVDLRVGGKFELFWQPENPNENSTIGCKILALDQPSFISFEWKGAKQHEEFMNNKRPLTNVSVCFIPLENAQTKVLLIHTGWGDTAEWEQARQWFESAWEKTLSQLEKVAGEKQYTNML